MYNEYLEYIQECEKELNRKKQQEQIKALTKNLQDEIAQLNGKKRFFGRRDSKVLSKEAKSKEKTLQQLESIKSELQDELQDTTGIKEGQNFKEVLNNFPSESASRPLSEAEFNQWLKAQLEEIRKPICLVLHTASGLIRFSADKYEAKSKMRITYEEFLKLNGML